LFVFYPTDNAQNQEITLNSIITFFLDIK